MHSHRMRSYFAPPTPGKGICYHQNIETSWEMHPWHSWNTANIRLEISQCKLEFDTFKRKWQNWEACISQSNAKTLSLCIWTEEIKNWNMEHIGSFSSLQVEKAACGDASIAECIATTRFILTARWFCVHLPQVLLVDDFSLKLYKLLEVKCIWS